MKPDDHRTFSFAGPQVIAKDFGEEVVVANLNSGIFYSLRESAIRIWSDIEQGRSLAEIIAAFSTGEAASDDAVGFSVQQFVDRLVAEALIVPSGKRDAANGRYQIENVTFTTAVIERFDDLQGLLLIDPIHDVTELGWPLVPLAVGVNG